MPWMSAAEGGSVFSQFAVGPVSLLDPGQGRLSGGSPCHRTNHIAHLAEGVTNDLARRGHRLPLLRRGCARAFWGRRHGWTAIAAALHSLAPSTHLARAERKKLRANLTIDLRNNHNRRAVYSNPTHCMGRRNERPSRFPSSWPLRVFCPHQAGLGETVGGA